MLARPGLLLLPAFGLFGPRLAVNKVLRRLLPAALLMAGLGCLLLAPAHPWAGVLLLAGLAGTAAAAAYALPGVRGLVDRLPKPLSALWPAAFYFVLGLLGMLLGVLDFARGTRIERWAPRKTA
jgi:hypothetical protein